MSRNKLIGLAAACTSVAGASLLWHNESCLEKLEKTNLQAAGLLEVERELHKSLYSAENGFALEGLVERPFTKICEEYNSLNTSQNREIIQQMGYLDLANGAYLTGTSFGFVAFTFHTRPLRFLFNRLNRRRDNI